MYAVPYPDGVIQESTQAVVTHLGHNPIACATPRSSGPWACTLLSVMMSDPVSLISTVIRLGWDFYAQCDATKINDAACGVLAELTKKLLGVLKSVEVDTPEALDEPWFDEVLKVPSSPRDTRGGLLHGA